MDDILFPFLKFNRSYDQRIFVSKLNAHPSMSGSEREFQTQLTLIIIDMKD